MSGAPAVDDNKALLRRWFDEVWNSGRAEKIDQYRSSDAVASGLAASPVQGKTPFEAFHSNLRAAFPDLRIHVEDMIGEGDKVAIRITAEGTHTRQGFGVDPTGKRVTFTGIIIARIVHGKIAEA